LAWENMEDSSDHRLSSGFGINFSRCKAKCYWTYIGRMITRLQSDALDVRNIDGADTKREAVMKIQIDRVD